MVGRERVAQAVADRLSATEAAIDAALVEASQLVREMLSARAELRLSATVGDGAVAKVAGALATLATARQQVVDARAELAEVKLRLGVRRSPPDDRQAAATPAPRDLRVVG